MNTLPWWKSKIIVGAFVSILSKVLVTAGVVGEISGEDEAQIAELTVLLIGGVGDAVAIGARLVQKQAPAITATK